MFDEADEVHISVVFTYDMERAEQLAKWWKWVAPVKIGGPATGEPSGDFTPGLYLKTGYTITSRGCPNKCWFCSVWKREGDVRELEIKEGWNILDDNLLACSDKHIKAVFDMLKRQKTKAEFTGGLEAGRLKQWQAEALFELKPKQIFFAYDNPEKFEALQCAMSMLKKAGFKTNTSHALRCFVLCGFPNDTFELAEKRLWDVIKIGYFPMAMLYRNNSGKAEQRWKKFQREWARPHIIARKIKDEAKS